MSENIYQALVNAVNQNDVVNTATNLTDLSRNQNLPDASGKVWQAAFTADNFTLYDLLGYFGIAQAQPNTVFSYLFAHFKTPPADETTAETFSSLLLRLNGYGYTLSAHALFNAQSTLPDDLLLVTFQHFLTHTPNATRAIHGAAKDFVSAFFSMARSTDTQTAILDILKNDAALDFSNPDNNLAREFINFSFSNDNLAFLEFFCPAYLRNVDNAKTPYVMRKIESMRHPENKTDTKTLLTVLRQAHALGFPLSQTSEGALRPIDQAAFFGLYNVVRLMTHLGVDGKKTATTAQDLSHQAVTGLAQLNSGKQDKLLKDVKFNDYIRLTNYLMTIGYSFRTKNGHGKTAEQMVLDENMGFTLRALRAKNPFPSNLPANVTPTGQTLTDKRMLATAQTTVDELSQLLGGMKKIPAALRRIDLAPPSTTLKEMADWLETMQTAPDSIVFIDNDKFTRIGNFIWLLAFQATDIKTALQPPLPAPVAEPIRRQAADTTTEVAEAALRQHPAGDYYVPGKLDTSCFLGNRNVYINARFMKSFPTGNGMHLQLEAKKLLADFAQFNDVVINMPKGWDFKKPKDEYDIYTIRTDRGHRIYLYTTDHVNFIACEIVSKADVSDTQKIDINTVKACDAYGHKQWEGALNFIAQSRAVTSAAGQPEPI